MTMKKFILTGFGPATTEENIQSILGGFGPVVNVDILRDGNATMLVAFVEMDIGDEQAFYLTSRISNFWHEGRMLNVWRVLH
jgi:hypothetical protein